MKASCLCGGVKYEITGPMRRARYCHCAHCRKFSGTGYAAWGLVEAAHLSLGQMNARVTNYDSGGGLRAFCSSCGSPLWFEPAGLPHLRGIPLGVIDDGDVPEPKMHVWTRSQAPWVSISDELPQHETHPQ